MNHSAKFQAIAISITFILIASLFSAGTVFADDATPPAPATEAPTQLPPSETPTETVLVEPVLTETLVSEPALESAETPNVLDQIPADTSLVVIVDGEVTPLATQDAANTIVNGDPIWCPSGASPIAGSGGCTASYTSLSSLLADLSAMNGGTGIGANGTIWIQDSYVSSINDPLTTSFTLNGTVLTTWTNYSLTLQGGWSGDNSGTISGVSDFSVPVSIDLWNNDVTLSDISISNTESARALRVETAGNIELNNVNVSNNTGKGALINNTLSIGDSVTIISSSFDNNNGDRGLEIWSNGEVTLQDITASGNRGIGALIYGGSYLDVTIENSTFNNNGLEAGLFVNNQGNIALKNVEASGNEFDGAALQSGMSVYVRGQENIFSGNNDYGLVIAAPNGELILSNVTANSNKQSGVALATQGEAVITCSQFNNNENYGIAITDPNDPNVTLTLNKVELSGNDLGDYHTSGTVHTNNVDCSNHDENSSQVPSKPIHVLSVSSDKVVGLNCTFYQGTLLNLPNGNSIYLPCPIHDSASATLVSESNLPNALPSGNVFGTGLSLQVSAGNQDETTVEQFMALSFVIPENMGNANLAVLYWDGTQWMELTSGLQLEKEGKVSEGGHISEDGMRFEASVNFTGIFVLVSK